MSWAQAMELAWHLTRLGWRARVTGRKNINGVWIYNAAPHR
jgi:hypothetical protein